MRTLLIALAAMIAFASPQLRADNQETPIRAGDKIGITIGGIPPEDASSINHLYPVSDSGTIKLLYLDDLNASGMKASELARKIERLYVSKEIYTHPAVTIALDTTGTERLVYVMGEVLKPGQVAFRDRMTVAKAISAAGGPGPFGHMSRVKLKRKGQVLKVLNLAKADNPDGDVQIEPEDEIVVPN